MRSPSTGVFALLCLKTLHPLEANAAAISNATRQLLDLLILVLLGLGSESGAGVDAEARGDLDRAVADRLRRALVLCDGREQLSRLLILALLDQREGRHLASGAEPRSACLRERLHPGDDLLRVELVELQCRLADQRRI